MVHSGKRNYLWGKAEYSYTFYYYCNFNDDEIPYRRFLVYPTSHYKTAAKECKFHQGKDIPPANMLIIEWQKEILKYTKC